MNSASRGTPPNPRGWYPPPPRPRPVEGGLKARSARGAIARTWWSQRFIAVLEDIGLGSRLQRGRTYARKGQVISLEVDPGSVTAEVQGSRARPYRIRIGSPRLGSPNGPKLSGAWLKCLVHRKTAVRRDARRHRGRLRRARPVAVPHHRPGAVAGTAPAPITPSRASTLPRPSTCWPRASTTTRSPSWRGAAASARICWPTWPPPAPRRRPPGALNKQLERSSTALTPITHGKPTSKSQARRRRHRRRCSTSSPTPASPPADGRCPNCCDPAYHALGRSGQAEPA